MAMVKVCYLSINIYDKSHRVMMTTQILEISYNTTNPYICCLTIKLNFFYEMSIN
jgi:hypothetical protein